MAVELIFFLLDSDDPRPSRIEAENYSNENDPLRCSGFDGFISERLTIKNLSSFSLSASARFVIPSITTAGDRFSDDSMSKPLCPPANRLNIHNKKVS